MSSASPSASPRPTLPSLKEMLSDVDFDKLRLRAAEDRREAANIPATTFTHSSDVGGERAQRQRRENCSWAPPSPRAPVAAHAVPHAVPHGLPYVDAPNVRFDVPSSARGFVMPPRLDLHHGAPSHPLSMTPSSSRSPSALQQMADRNLPTYVLSADECPPDDDRRHGCGICHRRFNRPSSLRIHMNSHTGEQPFECPFPGCSRRFSVNSNMRRHYRNHRDAANAATHAPSYPHPYYREQQPYMLHRMNSSPASSSTMSSFSDGEDYPDSPVISPQPRVIYSPPQGRTRSASEAYPPTQGRLASRPRACTISGCNCGEEAPGALRPAFQPGSSTPRYPPTSR